MNNTKSLFPLCPQPALSAAERVAKKQNEPNGMLSKPYSKPENRLFGNFTKPFYPKRTQWYV